MNIPIYVSRSIDLTLSTNGYLQLHCDENKNEMWKEIQKILAGTDPETINNMALQSGVEFENNAYSAAESEAFYTCERNNRFTEGDYDLPSEHFDPDNFQNINYPWST